ncbi:hypothetical protein TNCV_4831421 [Trichonephila clavipes]|nr:hypothetical protein TNCV_4831421 [Trichonephila clavipes]
MNARREPDCKLNLDSPENFTQAHCCGVHNKCSLLQANSKFDFRGTLNYPQVMDMGVDYKDFVIDDEVHFWLNGYVNKQNCRIWNEANPQVYVETPLHQEKLTVWCPLWAGGILLQKR